MYTLSNAQVIFHSLVLLLMTTAFNAVASDHYHDVMSNSADQQKWVCDYSRGYDDVLYLRCDNLMSLYNDPLIMEGDYQDNSTKFIPIWRKSSNPQGAVKLVKAVLCNQDAQCSVQMKSLFAAR
ncbi:MAG: hypothetical protein B6D71_13390 [gamma proteobacterium symbiont of Stewartia floridana]|nr:MAG: hypothetical protein B6D71_13390 [gamma proteobacterium symbiont of Stewartia floridana]